MPRIDGSTQMVDNLVIKDLINNTAGASSIRVSKTDRKGDKGVQ